MSLVYHVNMLSHSVGSLNVKLPKRRTLSNLFNAVKAKDRREIGYQLEGITSKKINRQKDIYDGRWTILLFAIFEGDVETTKRLLSLGANPNKMGRVLKPLRTNPSHIYATVPLSLAIDQKNIQLVKLLLDWGADVNLTMPDTQYEEEGGLMQYSPKSNLNKAIERGNCKIVEILLQYGKDVSLVDSFGVSSLDFACGSLSVGVVDVLVRYGGKTLYKHGDFIDNSFGYMISETFTDADFGINLHCARKKVKAIKFILAADYNYIGCSSHLALREVYDRMAPELEVSESDVTKDFFVWAQHIKNYVKQPSSLSQITRATIRSVLGTKCRPESIRTLPLPDLLINFVNLEDEYVR